MNKKDRILLNEKLAVLPGLELCTITRNSGMLGLSFGDLTYVDAGYKNEADKKMEHKIQIGTYALLIKCTFRIFQGKDVLLSQDDYYRPSSKISPDDYATFDSDQIGNTLWDEAMQKLFAVKSEFVVKDVKVSMFGDLKLSFTNGILLEALINVSNDEDCWRFYKSGEEEDDDLVITGQGLWQY